MLKKDDLEDLQENLDNLLKQKGVNKDLKTLIIKIKRHKPEHLTEQEIDFLEKQSDIYMEKYQNYAYLFQISESIDNIKSLYEEED